MGPGACKPFITCILLYIFPCQIRTICGFVDAYARAQCVFVLAMNVIQQDLTGTIRIAKSCMLTSYDRYI